MHGTFTKNDSRKLLFIFKFPNRILFLKIIKKYFQELLSKNVFFKNCLENVIKQNPNFLFGFRIELELLRFADKFLHQLIMKCAFSVVTILNCLESFHCGISLIISISKMVMGVAYRCSMGKHQREQKTQSMLQTSKHMKIPGLLSPHMYTLDPSRRK